MILRVNYYTFNVPNSQSDIMIVDKMLDDIDEKLGIMLDSDNMYVNKIPSDYRLAHILSKFGEVWHYVI